MSLFRAFIVFPITGALVVAGGACGGSVADVPSQRAPHDTSPGDDGRPAPGADTSGTAATGGTAGVTGPQTVIGHLFALTDSASGQVTQRFDMDFELEPPPGAMCDQATSTVGSCCYFSPTPRPPTLLAGDGGGAPAAETSAGTVTFTDVTSSSSIATFDYQNGVYAHAPGVYQNQVWQPGDVLRVTATGAQVGPFTVTAPGLVPPIVQAPAAFTAGEDVSITWQPDANAEALVFSLLDGGTGASVACSASDAAGTLKVEGSLLASAFPASTRLSALAERSAVRYAQTATGRVAFKTMGWLTFDASTK